MKVTKEICDICGQDMSVPHQGFRGRGALSFHIISGRDSGGAKREIKKRDICILCALGLEVALNNQLTQLKKLKPKGGTYNEQQP